MRFISVVAMCLFSAGLVFSQSGFLADRHADYGADCIDCHDSQTPEKDAWVEYDKCIGCHGKWDELSKFTERYGEFNPHKGHLGEIDCTICHKGHTASEIYCSTCHSTLDPKMK